MSNTSSEQILKELKENAYAVLPFGLSREEMEQAASDFMGFLSLPQEIKNKFFFKLDLKNRGSGVGYVRKSKFSGDGDNKEYFHYNLYAEDFFKEMPESQNIPEVKKFFDVARRIYDEASKTLSKTLTVLEERHPGIYNKFFHKDKHPFFYLRFLKYDISGKGKFLARAHYDRGECTLALAESAPGLRIGRNEETLKEVNRVDNTVLFMPALRFSEVVPGDFYPAWHDVIQKSDDVYSESAARWAIVFFADTQVENYVTLGEAHTQRH